MRALFIEHQDKIKDGKYIIVAKESITTSKYSDIKVSFFNSLKRVDALK